ncbi:hypothetical protein CPSG_06850 [Coccidioides posadasii str. Silveira]|uniref:Uncharacterized protein n=1 Tax=Coccidioides posadasii (strain RMSCC 757 / Silveira) TaxID=443226 RepID=E9DAJ8_COCPS|nr:hypothetical protein CPSG_06850 [Coccidioides posadasii str. Silveira]
MNIQLTEPISSQRNTDFNVSNTPSGSTLAAASRLTKDTTRDDLLCCIYTHMYATTALMPACSVSAIKPSDLFDPMAYMIGCEPCSVKILFRVAFNRCFSLLLSDPITLFADNAGISL